MRWAGFGSLLVLLGCDGSDESASPLPSGKALPSLLLVTMDTTRADRLGCYGGPRGLTPALDVLAERSWVFERAYTVAPMTLPAHATLLTGELPPVHGVRVNGRHRLPDDSWTLAEHLRESNYQTAAFLSARVLDAQYGLNAGFDVYDVGNDRLGGRAAWRPAPATTDATLEWLSQIGEEPFFLWLHYFDPHTPYETPPDLAGRFESAYDAEIHQVDRHLDRVLRALETSGRVNDTVICVTADHGESLGEHGEKDHGYLLYDATVRIPLLLAVPEGGAGRVRGAVGLGDLAPTLCELLGVDPMPCSGSSFAHWLGASDPGLAGSEDDVADGHYVESYTGYFSLGWSPLEAIVRAPWKYIDSPAPELYHLDQDPGELEDRAAAEPRLVAELAAELRAIRSRSRRAGSAAFEIDEAERQRLQALGYLPPGGSEELESDLPEPGPDAGDDPRALAHLLPILHAIEAQKARPSPRLEELCRQVLNEDPDNPNALRTLGVYWTRTGRGAEALELLRQVDDAGRSTPLSLEALAVALEGSGDREGAVEALVRLLERVPERITTRRKLAELLEALGRNEDAAAQLEAVLELDPELPDRAGIERVLERLRAR